MATVKQKLAFKKVLKGSTITKAMKEVGYAKTTASTTGKLTNSDGWKELIDKHISEEALAKVHAEGLKAMATKFSPEGELLELPDYSTRHKYLETGYKVRSRLNPEEQENRGGNNITNITQIIINSPYDAEIGNQSNG